MALVTTVILHLLNVTYYWGLEISRAILILDFLDTALPPPKN